MGNLSKVPLSHWQWGTTFNTSQGEKTAPLFSDITEGSKIKVDALGIVGLSPLAHANNLRSYKNAVRQFDEEGRQTCYMYEAVSYYFDLPLHVIDFIFHPHFYNDIINLGWPEISPEIVLFRCQAIRNCEESRGDYWKTIRLWLDRDTPLEVGRPELLLSLINLMNMRKNNHA